MSVRELEELALFEMWAFGYIDPPYDLSTIDAWNERHGKVYTAMPDDKVVGSLSKMYLIYKLNKEKKMDKQIKKVKKDVEKGDKPKAKKDIAKLMKMDKKFDKEIDKCKDMKEKKKK